MESNEDKSNAPKKRTCTKKDSNSNSNEYERGFNADNNDEFIPVDYETESEEKAPKKIKGRLKSAISMSRMPESKKDNENDEEDHDRESIEYTENGGNVWLGQLVNDNVEEYTNRVGKQVQFRKRNFITTIIDQLANENR
jgi:hypothetical protein